MLSFSRTLKRIKPFSRISLDLSLNGTFALILLRSLLYRYWVLCPGDPSYWVSLTRSIFALWQSIIHVGSMIGPCFNLEFESTNFLPFFENLLSVVESVSRFIFWDLCPAHFESFDSSQSGELHFQLNDRPRQKPGQAGKCVCISYKRNLVILFVTICFVVILCTTYHYLFPYLAVYSYII